MVIRVSPHLWVGGGTQHDLRVVFPLRLGWGIVLLICMLPKMSCGEAAWVHVSCIA